MDRPLPEVRIGDRERREVDAALQAALADGVLTLTEYDERAAQCWAARTRGDLELLTRDLPAPSPPAAPKRAVEVAPATKSSGSSVVGRIVSGVVTAALVGGGLFLGWQVVSADDGVSVFGSRVVQVVPGQDRVEVGMLFGSVRVVVPDNVHVRTAGTVVFGSMRCDQACQSGAGLREVIVEAHGGFGSVNIVRPNELDPDES